MIGWKVLDRRFYLIKTNRDWSKYCSATVPDSSFAKTYYWMGDWTLPKTGCGPLTVFDTLKNALKFEHNSVETYSEILPCEFIPSESTKVWVQDVSRGIKDLPKGTILADAVRIF